MQLYQHFRRNRICAAAAVMNDLRVMKKTDLPSCLLRPPTPIRFFGIEKEGFIHQADLFDHRSANQQKGAHHLIDLNGAAVVKPGKVKMPDKFIFGEKAIQVKALKKIVPRLREMLTGRLQTAIAVQQFAACDANVRMGIEKGDGFIYGAIENFGVGVEQQNKFALCLLDALVVSRRETAIIDIENSAHLWKVLRQHLAAVIG